MTLLLAALLVLPSAAVAQVSNTRHNLSVSGPGPIRAASESEVCVFCHAPHNTSTIGQLWNRRASLATFVPYSSSTTRATLGQPTGASILCLSCHDGTVALGSVLSRDSQIAMSGGTTTMPAGNSRIGPNLTRHHPVSFQYTAALASLRGELANPAALRPEVRLDAASQLQCTTCHDAHSDANGEFLVLANPSSALCKACHLKTGWNETAHSTSTKTWNGSGQNPWPSSPYTTVATNACRSCHQPHSSSGGPRLLRYASEEQNCSDCHNANVALRNVMSAIALTSRHSVSATTSVHDPVEPAVVAARHVECVDCHDPHAARANANPTEGTIRNVGGITLAGAAVKPVTRIYEVCFRCHADSPGKPAPRTTRQIAQTNTRLEFQLGNPSFHPVAGPGRNPNVPSLISPWTTSSVMSCVDCHNNNASHKLGGSGADGPHGSAFAPILNRQYVTTDNASESASNYALCYACHSRTSILGDNSFREHRKHIEGERTPCNICHDPHGVSATQGTETNNTHLINFNTAVVTPSNGQLRFVDQGVFRGACYLNCHGRNHNPESY